MRKLVLWGHTPEEYIEMFDLKPEDLKAKILEFGSGPSAFNAIMQANGGRVVSVDPLFVLDKDTLKSKSALIFNEMKQEVLKHHDKFDFSRYGHLESLVMERQDGMNLFFKDYSKGKKDGRYIGITSSNLPFNDFQFDMALVSHYLFALEDQSVEFQLDIIKELCRVAKEVRIFPLIDRYGRTSEFIGPVLLELQSSGFGAEIRQVDYHLQPKGNAMLRVFAQKCDL